MNIWKKLAVLFFVVLVSSGLVIGGATEQPEKVVKDQAGNGNDPERIEWFKDMGLGMFIHWSVDSQLGMVISHSLVGASDEYKERYFNELPKTFCPKKFDPDDWARLAKLAGMKYVVFTTKHHSGFCMFDTKTTDFNIINTPYGKDITKQIFDAFRKYDIAIGIYFAPDDFSFQYRQGYEISRRTVRTSIPSNNPEMMAYNKKQIKELLTNYGKIDVLFFDADPNQLKQMAWQIDPEIVVTRGEMETPEQFMPNKPMPGPWEANYTLGTQWQFKPTNEDYKSGTDLIEMLIEIRAKGGNFLLNVGPTPNGEIPFEQERRIQELALWNFINGQAVFNIRPWHVIREGNIWFTKAKDSDTVYAIVTKEEWPRNYSGGTWKEFTLKSVAATEKTEIEILGQNGKIYEYVKGTVPKTTWKQDEDGLHIRAMRAQRIYNDRKWPNPVVLKITNAKAVK